eukprot:m.163356 g.163356  ORF g.163356 m.163356 type:complete len:112 (-) comp16389_c0_seq16:3186-3521(-)
MCMYMCIYVCICVCVCMFMWMCAFVSDVYIRDYVYFLLFLFFVFLFFFVSSFCKLSSLSGFVSQDQASQHLQAFQKSHNIFVDCTASDSVSELLQEALSNEAGVVFATKNA